jgi:hypothetical protein
MNPVIKRIPEGGGTCSRHPDRPAVSRIIEQRHYDGEYRLYRRLACEVCTRVAESNPHHPNRNYLKAVCACGRIIRMAPSNFYTAGVVCGNCKQPFKEETT